MNRDFDYYMLDKDNNPVGTNDIKLYGQWKRTPEAEAQRAVGRDEVGEYYIRTSFILIDHGFGAGGPPVLWETLITGPEGSEYDQFIDRYTSHAAALRGHKKYVERLRAALPPPEEPPAPVKHLKGRKRPIMDDE